MIYTIKLMIIQWNISPHNINQITKINRPERHSWCLLVEHGMFHEKFVIAI